VTALDPDQQVARATEYRAAKAELDAAVLSCRLAWAFAARRAGEYISDSSAYLETAHVHERRVHAVGLKTHSGRIRALKSLTEYVRTL
jgi:hypothetical protein